MGNHQTWRTQEEDEGEGQVKGPHVCFLHIKEDRWKIVRQPQSTGDDGGFLEPDLWGGDILRRKRQH